MQVAKYQNVVFKMSITIGDLQEGTEFVLKVGLKFATHMAVLKFISKKFSPPDEQLPVRPPVSALSITGSA